MDDNDFAWLHATKATVYRWLTSDRREGASVEQVLNVQYDLGWLTEEEYILAVMLFG